MCALNQNQNQCCVFFFHVPRFLCYCVNFNSCLRCDSFRFRSQFEIMSSAAAAAAATAAAVAIMSLALIHTAKNFKNEILVCCLYTVHATLLHLCAPLNRDDSSIMQ